MKISKKIEDRICTLIPKLSNRTVIAFYEFLRVINKFKINTNKEKTKIRTDKNRQLQENHIDQIVKNDGYIEDQNNYTDLRYGKVTMQFAGCEIIAAYNAINSMISDRVTDLAEMISDFEKDGCVLSGKFGTSPKAIAKYLDNHGFITAFSHKEKEFEKIAEEYESIILTIYNDVTDIRKQIHTINVSKKYGNYMAHNVYCNGKAFGPFNSINELIYNINKGKSKGISIIGIRRNSNE